MKENLSFPNRYNLSQEEMKISMSFESPIAMCLPSQIGLGRVALFMVEYLVEKQNSILIKCRDIIVPKPS